MSYPERVAFDWLSNNEIKFIHQYKTDTYDGCRYVDFYIPDKILFIEIDGKFSHQDKLEDDELKDKYAKEVQGIDTVRICAEDRIEDRLKEIFNI